MGRALELVSGSATAPGATLTAMTAFSGNSFNIRSFPFESYAALVQAWADNQAAGVLRYRSARMHDAAQGLRFSTVAGRVQPLLADQVKQTLYPQDAITAEISGSAVAGDVEVGCFLAYYDDLPGVEAQLFAPEEIFGRIKNYAAVFNSIAKGAAGGYSGEESIDENASLKANTLYAILGGYTDTEVAAVRYRGPFAGNLGLGFPGEPDIAHVTNDWFVSLSQQLGKPCIPVFNSADRGNTLIDVAGDENAATVLVTTVLAELG